MTTIIPLKEVQKVSSLSINTRAKKGMKGANL
jgi:hypothetical protein